MAKKRKKTRSLNSIAEQRRRISRSDYTDRRRVDQAMKIARQYEENIRKSDAYKKDYEYLQEYANEAYDNGYEKAGELVRTYRGSTPSGGDDPSEYKLIVDESAFPKLSERRYKREYSREVYQQGKPSVTPRSKFANIRSGKVSAMGMVGG